jgi:hypothetical protein
MAGFLLIKIMSKLSYYEKLQHPLWQRKRLEIMEKSGFSCKACEAKDVQLNVHHIYYISKRDPWNYPDWSLECLCKDCHKERHDNELEPMQEYREEMFEMIYGFLHDGKEGDDIWDVCTEFAYMRKNYPNLFQQFNTDVLYYAEKLRKEAETNQ